jgi:flagellar biosynthetic protein FliP
VTAVPGPRRLVLAFATGLGLLGLCLLTAPSAGASARPAAVGLSNVSAGSRLAAGPSAPTAPTSPGAPKAPTGTPSDITLNVPGQPSQVVTIILLVTVLGIAPAVLLMCTSFTKIVVVLSLTRTALGTPTVPPNQVMVGLALFLSLFVMGPVLTQMNDSGVQPYLNGTKSSSEAYHDASGPLRVFMLKHTRAEELALMSKAAGQTLPKDRTSVDLRTLIPAFVLSELRAAFIIGFVIFVPFLVIDIVVSAVLMSLGMVMLPPSLVSLPFKLLLFVLVDGWSLIVTTLLGSYR